MGVDVEQVANHTFFDPFGGNGAGFGRGRGTRRRAGTRPDPGSACAARTATRRRDPDRFQRYDEFEGLQAQLASPETFRRVGLEPPQGAASSLRFEPALDASGRPVIRVTSAVPIQQPLLTFLLEVDWGQGRLVREYSALIDAPRTVAAPMQPPIQAPSVSPSNAIVRPPAPAIAATPAAAPTAPTSRPTPSAAVPSPRPVAAVPAAPARQSMRLRQPLRPSSTGPVKAGQTPGRDRCERGGAQGYSVAQTMLALLRATPAKPRSAETSTSSSAAPCCGCRRRTNWRSSTSARPPRWCTNRSRSGAPRAGRCRSRRRRR